MKLNDVIEVEIIDEDINGNGVAKINNFVIFISNALLGEKLKVKIIEINKNFAKGIILEILVKSKERIDIKCPYYKSCGGCCFLHTNYSNERKIKQNYIEKLFNKNIVYLETKNVYEYRNKVTLHIKNNKLGFYNEKTHDICEINNCLLLNQNINKLILKLSEININGINEIMIRSVNNKTMININCDNYSDEILNLEVNSLYINNSYIKGEKYLIDEINNLKYSIYPDSFYQINKEGMTNIYNKALEYIPKSNKLLDLYCGTGTIGIWLKDKYNEIVGCEINESSIKNANINKKLNNIKNVKFICSDAKNIKGKYDSIVVDPPRSGLSKDVIKFLNDSKCKNILYISCNPKTLKRDLDLLNNYESKDIFICDMFPRTKHVETVCVLERL